METEWLDELFRFICLFIRRPVMEHTEKEDAVDFFRFHTMEKMATDGWENPAQDMAIEAVYNANKLRQTNRLHQPI